MRHFFILLILFFTTHITADTRPVNLESKEQTNCDITVFSSYGNIQIFGLQEGYSTRIRDADGSSVWACNGFTSNACRNVEIAKDLIIGETYNITITSQFCNDFISIVIVAGTENPNCYDCVQNQNEEGTDCGGPCAPCPSCDDGILNQGEDDVDCGGPCPTCTTLCDIAVASENSSVIITGGTNQHKLRLITGGIMIWSCGYSTSDPCQNIEIIPNLNDVIHFVEVEVGSCDAYIDINVIEGTNASCNDGIQNQGEQGIDCGGPCAPCATCNDGIQNQGEQGIDCGGPCAPCVNEECNVSVSSSNGIINILGLTNNENAKLFDSNISEVFSCNPWNGNPCTGNESASGVQGATYFLSVQSDLCDEWIPVIVQGGGNGNCNDGIQNQGEQGVDCGGPCPACASCDDGIQNQGEEEIDCGGPCAPCDTGNNECNVEVTSANGSITITGLTTFENTKLFNSNISDVFNCNPWNGNPCNNIETVSNLPAGAIYFLSVQSNNCSEWIPITVQGDFNCVDTDTDGLCDDVDCAPNNPSLPAPLDTPCNDFNATTINDVIVADGCTCKGNPVESGCNINIETGTGPVIISGLSALQNVKVFDINFGVVFECNPWFGAPCNNVESISGLQFGATYFLSAQSNNCSRWIEFTVGQNPTEMDGSNSGFQNNAAANISSVFSIGQIFPNPVNDEAFIKVESSFEGEFSLEVYDLVGQLQQNSLTQIEEGINTIELEISNLKTGIYHLIMRDKSGEMKSARFVKN